MAKPDYAARRARERGERITRARRNMMQGSLSAESLTPAPDSASDRAIAGFALALGMAVVGHVGVALAAFYTTPAPADKNHSPVQVRVLMAPKPVPVVPPPQPKPEILAEPVARATPRPRPVAVRPAEPVAPRAEQAVAEPVAIVGLTLESSSRSSSGPAFAIGQTLAGTTERIAPSARTAVPDLVRAAPAAVLPVSRNRRAAPQPAAGVQVKKAQRLARVEPEYPPLLERQRIEADVTVRVQIAADGQLLQAELVRAAEHPAFNEAALLAARKERFSAETHDGRAVETFLTYTYRFRITP